MCVTFLSFLINPDHGCIRLLHEVKVSGFGMVVRGKVSNMILAYCVKYLE